MPVTVRFLDAEGRPLAGVGVVVGVPSTLTTRAALTSPMIRSDDAGHVRLQIASDVLRWHAVLAAAPGKAAWISWLPWGQARLDGAVDLGPVRLDEGRTLRGRVLGPGGKPMPGATVTATDLLTDRRRARLESRGICESDGSFELDGVSPAGMRVVVGAPGHYLLTLPYVDAAEPLHVELQASGYVSGRVLAPPSIARRLRLRLDSELSDGFELEPLGQGGRFRCTVERPGRVRLVVHEPTGDDLSSIGMSEILTGPTDNVFVATAWSDEQPALVVRARDRETQKLLAPIRARADWGDTQARFVRAADLSNCVVSNEKGAVRLMPPPDARTATVVAVADGYAPAVVKDVIWEAAKAAEVIVDLERESVLEGRVVEATTQRPMVGTVVDIAVASGGRVRRVRTVDGGSFRIGGLAAERYRVEAIAATGEVLARVSGIDVGVAQRRTDVELRVQPPTLLRGKIAGVPGADDLAVALGQATRTLPLAGRRPLGADGAFELACAVDLPAELILIEPAVPRGCWRHHWLGTLQTAGESRAFEVPKGRRMVVRGRVGTGELVVPARRLLMSIQPRDVLTKTSPFEVAMSWWEGPHWTFVEADGTYETDVVPVPLRIACIDAVSGVELARVERDPAAGPLGTVDFELKLAAIDCRFPDPFGRELWIDVGGERHQRGLTSGGRLMDEAAITLGATVRDVTVLVPAGDVTLSVRSGWRFAGSGKGRSDGDPPLKQTSLTLQAGERRVVELRQVGK